MGRKRRTPPSQTELEEESSSSLAAGAPRGSLSPKASPSPRPIYIGGLGLFETQLCHVQLKPIPRSSSSRSDFCGARAEPCRSRSSPPSEHCHAAGELIYFSVLLAGSRRPRSSSSCTCAERGGDVRSTLDRSGSRDGSRGVSRDVRRFHYINRVS